MKQILILITLGLIVNGTVHGQELKKINYQFDIGTTFTIPYKNTIESWPDLENHPQTDYRTDFGYFLELLVSYNLSNKYAISTGLNYNHNSLKIDNKNGLIENEGNLTSSYITLPILLKVRFFDKIPVSISTGPYISFFINANEKGTTYINFDELVGPEPDPSIQPVDQFQKYDTNITEDYTSIDYGLSLQFDYEIRLSKELNGVILTRFNYGLNDVITNNLVNNNLANNWKNYNLIIGLGLKL